MGPVNDNRQHKALLEGLAELYGCQLLCDVTISINGQDILCHKVVLAASSKYFR